MAQYKLLVQCFLHSGTGRLTAFVPLEKARVGHKGMFEGRNWEIITVYNHVVVSSEYIAWYASLNITED